MNIFAGFYVISSVKQWNAVNTMMIYRGWVRLRGISVTLTLNVILPCDKVKGHAAKLVRNAIS